MKPTRDLPTADAARSRRRPARGRQVWDRAVRLARARAQASRRRCRTPPRSRCPPELRQRDRAARCAVPGEALGRRSRRSGPVQRRYGWFSPGGDRPGGRGDAASRPAYLESVASFYDMFELEPAGEHQVLRLHQHLLLAARRRRRCSTRSARRPARRATAPAPRTASSSCAGSSAWAPATSRRWPRSTSATTGPLTARGRRARSSSSCAARRARCCPRSGSRTASAAGGATADAATDARHASRRGRAMRPRPDPLPQHRRAGPAPRSRPTSSSAATRRCARRSPR